MNSFSSLLPDASWHRRHVKKLMGWKQGDEEERWAARAEEALIKKLKKAKGEGEYEKLKKAWAVRDDGSSECVVMPRSQDGRLQMSHRKILPHVLVCRLWRFPDLQSQHELKAKDCCQFPFSAKHNKDVCINPYHYMRVEASGVLPPILVPRFSDPLPGPSSTHMGQASGMHQEMQPFNVAYNQNGFNSPPMVSGFTGAPGSPNMGDGAGNPQSPFSQSSNGSPPGYSAQGNMDMTQQGGSGMEAQYQGQQQQMGMDPSSMGTSYTPVAYEPANNWSSISYYEMNTRVGETYYSTTSHVYVDGFTHPVTIPEGSNSNHRSRFCLGQISNVNRNPTTENTRCHIGKGVHLYHVNYEVYAECLSDSPIFVQSRLCNYSNGFLHTTVCKIPPGCSLKIFDFNDFQHLLNQYVKEGYESVFELTKVCTIRMSFVKGWGADYHRQDVTSTPCWIEIHLNDALQWLDRILMEMGPPTNKITSVS